MIPAIDRNFINAQAIQLAKDLDKIFLRGQEFKVFLDGYPDGNMIADFGYAQADINLLKSAIADVDALRLVYQGTTPQVSVKDFRLFLKQIWGLGALF